MINEHKPTVELNNSNNNNNNNNNNNSNNNSSNNSNINNNTNNNNNNNEENDRAEWKIQLVMQNNFISVKDFEDTRTIYSASKPFEVFIGSDAEMTLIHFLIKFQIAIEKNSTSNRNIK